MVNEDGAHAPAVSEDGAEQAGGYSPAYPPSIQGYAMAPGKGGGSDALAREVMHFPQDVDQFITRTQLTMTEVARKKRIRARWNIFHLGYSNVPALEWYDMGLRVSVDRQGRREMVDVLIAERRHDQLKRGILRKARDMDKNEITGPGGQE